ncbi:hypothetical protein PLICRDRAFT_513043 [Plicaturopsis crispa FD-325 SS-3]|nr:hypothetical protein PLICRDRAFT_513043 [Plicaturopsis crispa FD-325 SS-3]
MSCLSSLPIELLARIISLGSISDILSWQLTSRLFQNIIQESSELQYRFNALAAGVRDNPRSHLSYSERLLKLRERDNAWANLDARARVRVPLSKRQCGTYDLTGGVYVQGERGNGEASISHPHNTSLKYIVLPSTDGVEEQSPTWSTIHADHHIVDFGLCIQEHGLIALVTTRSVGSDVVVEIVLLDFFTGKPHAAAAHPVLNTEISAKSSLTLTISIEIVGDYLALIVGRYYSLSDFILYDWKTGTAKARLERQNLPHDTLAFLDKNTIVLTNPEWEVLEVYRIYENPWEFRKVLGFRLPDTGVWVRPSNIICRAELNPIGDSPTRSCAQDPCHYDKRPFFEASEEAVLLLSLLYLLEGVAGGAPTRQYSVLVHRRSILDLIPSDIRSRSSESWDDMVWEDWGPSVTRWNNTADIATQWITATTGQRYAFIKDSHVSPQRIHVLDFNQNTCRRLRSAQAQDKGTRAPSVSTPPSEELPSPIFSQPVLRDSPYVIPAGDVFVHDVESKLPYVLSLSKDTYTHTVVLMDEERILGFTTDEDDFITSIDVLLFG